MGPRMFQHPVYAAAALALLLAAAGCGGKPTGELAGAVTYRGKPVTNGEVHLLSKGGVGALARLDGDGKFAVPAPLDAGTYAVAVKPPAAEPGPPGAAVKKAPPLPIPARARDLGTSGLTVEVKPGKNDVAVELKD